MDSFSDERCGNCKFWRLWKPSSMIGECQRYPPLIVVQDGELNSYFPDTSVRQCCGEWRPAPPLLPAAAEKPAP